MLVNDQRTQKQTHQLQLTDSSEGTKNMPQYTGCRGNWVTTWKSAGHAKVLVPTDQQRNEECEYCRVASSKEEMSTCFPAESAEWLLLTNQQSQTSPKFPKMFIRLFFLDSYLQSCFSVNRNHFMEKVICTLQPATFYAILVGDHTRSWALTLQNLSSYSHVL